MVWICNRVTTAVMMAVQVCATAASLRLSAVHLGSLVQLQLKKKQRSV